MASSDKTTKLRSSDEGMRIVTSTSPLNDIKRPVYGAVDVHKSGLMATACVTDKESLNVVFYVRQFPSSNCDIRLMDDCSLSMALWISAWNQPRN